MSANLIAYWADYLKLEKENVITKEDYIFKYTIINQHSSLGVENWLCCKSKPKLYAFIKYVILPAIQVSRMLRESTQEICFEALGYHETIDILNNIDSEKRAEIISKYQEWFKKVEELEKKDVAFEEIKQFITSINMDVDYRHELHVELDVYENISKVGSTLIEEYEKDDMIDVLEYEMKLKKDEIEELFNNINDNKFMLNKITTLLNERFGI